MVRLYAMKNMWSCPVLGPRVALDRVVPVDALHRHTLTHARSLTTIHASVIMANQAMVLAAVRVTSTKLAKEKIAADVTSAPQ